MEVRVLVVTQSRVWERGAPGDRPWGEPEERALRETGFPLELWEDARLSVVEWDMPLRLTIEAWAGGLNMAAYFRGCRRIYEAWTECRL